MAEELNIEAMEQLLDEFGHVHFTVEELGEKDASKGNVEFDYDAGVIIVDDGVHEHRYGMDRIVHYYPKKGDH